MNRKLIAIALPAVLCVQSAWADVVIKMPNNFEVLATEQVRIKKATKEVVLPEGDQHLVVRFDSPTNPHSTAQSLGFVRSNPLLVSFNALDGEEIKLIAPRVDSPQEVKKYARNVTFKLVNEKGVEVDHEVKVLEYEGSPMMADFNAMLAAQLGMTSAAPTLSSVAVEDATHSKVVENSQIDVSKLTPAQADALLRELYRGADEQRRKEFMRWALGL